jgi:hypothetical protein
LLSLLSQTAYESVRECFQELFQRNDVRPGGVSSIQTFGSFAANFKSSPFSPSPRSWTKFSGTFKKRPTALRLGAFP